VFLDAPVKTLLSILLALTFSALGCATQATDPGANPEGGADRAAAPERNHEVQGQADRIEKAEARDEERASPRQVTTEPEADQRFENDPEARHRARTFYLIGVRYLGERPPSVDDAIREFHHALQQDPLFYKAHFKLGYAYYHKGEYQLEQAEYLKCLSIKPTYLPALINLGHAYLAQDQLEQARLAYRRALDEQPNHSVCQYNLGLIEFDLGHWTVSGRYLRAFLRTAPNEAEGGMREQARKCLDRIREKPSQEGGTK
jgi:tetratricopeptide (TPR) repeat protein